MPERGLFGGRAVLVALRARQCPQDAEVRGDVCGRWWGALNAERNVLGYSATRCRIIRNYNSPLYDKVCGRNLAAWGSAEGDSGARVTYTGRGNRHVAGVMGAGSTYTPAYIPANSIKTAFANSRVNGRSMGFSHYGGTKAGYRTPSPRPCDPPSC